MKVKLWGVRGSLPAPLLPEQQYQKNLSALKRFLEAQSLNPNITPEEFLNSLPVYESKGFGGHTACIQVQTSLQDIIVDGGSGIRKLGEVLMCGPCGLGRGEVHLLMTHFHWDHLIGLPFFVPLFIPGNKIHIYSVQDNAEDSIRTLFKKPNFPVPYEALGAEFIYHILEPRKTVEFKDLSVTPYQLDHPDPCWGYKFEHNNKAFSYCVDTEGTRVSAKELGDDLALYQNIDVMVFDAQYTFLEATEKVNWGHSSAPIGLDIAMREGIKRVYFVHHDPAASDEKIMIAEKQTRDYYQTRIKALKQQNIQFKEVDWEFAIEGTEFEL